MCWACFERLLKVFGRRTVQQAGKGCNFCRLRPLRTGQAVASESSPGDLPSRHTLPSPLAANHAEHTSTDSRTGVKGCMSLAAQRRVATLTRQLTSAPAELEGFDPVPAVSDVVGETDTAFDPRRLYE